VSLITPHTGRLLVASPLLGDPNFRRTVVYLLDHNAQGTFGVVLTRPVGAEAPEPLHGWQLHLAPPGEVFYGGPVQPDGIVGVGLDRSGVVQTVDLADEDPSAYQAVRLFHGYSGWSSGQLRAEISEDAWLVVDSAATDLFDPEPETLWRRVLARQRGEVAWLAGFPADVFMN
jgi:putative transcriptional regulator